MTVRITIRPTRPTDTAVLEGIARAAYREAMEALDGVPDVVGSIAADMRGNPGWVVEVDGIAAGFLIARIDRPALKLVNLAVAPDHAGQGLARRLLDEAARRAQAEGLTRLELVTHAGMQATRAMYRHLGWSEDRVTGGAAFLSKTL